MVTRSPLMLCRAAEVSKIPDPIRNPSQMLSPFPSYSTRVPACTKTNAQLIIATLCARSLLFAHTSPPSTSQLVSHHLSSLTPSFGLRDRVWTWMLINFMSPKSISVTKDMRTCKSYMVQFSPASLNTWWQDVYVNLSESRSELFLDVIRGHTRPWRQFRSCSVTSCYLVDVKVNKPDGSLRTRQCVGVKKISSRL